MSHSSWIVVSAVAVFGVFADMYYYLALLNARDAGRRRASGGSVVVTHDSDDPEIP